jgi:hypothetical protein
MQQVEQFQRMGEQFDIRHKESEKMRQTLDELKAAVISELPPEDRLRGMEPEQIAEALNEDEQHRLLELLKKKGRYRGRMSPEQFLQSLDEQEQRRLLELLKKKLENGK